MSDPGTPPDNPYGRSYWRKVYLLVIGFLFFFCLVMYLFTRFTS